MEINCSKLNYASAHDKKQILSQIESERLGQEATDIVVGGNDNEHNGGRVRLTQYQFILMQVV